MRDIKKVHKMEKKWQERWLQEKVYHAVDFDEKPKYYALVEFPYPSGAGMHIGHTHNYSMFDALARVKRMDGYNVLYPIGWDAFGLPAENYAIKMKRNPQDTVKENIDNFRRQLQSLGLSFDWDREVNTTDPEYYKWTQWIFLQFYKRGLAYKAEAEMAWCPKCKTICANEEVVDGKHERCNTPVGKKKSSQWFFAITKYADRLIEELDQVDFPDFVKASQINWIGKKIWTDVRFKIDGTDEVVEVSTTRPDTIFGVTFVVIAPEHELLQKLMGKVPEQYKQNLIDYIEATKAKTEMDRLAEGRKKTGAFTGLYCINPVNNEKIPLYAADFVLTTVGTGMVMGVPGHDVRDFEFAQVMDLPVKRVLVGPDGDDGPIDDVSKVNEDLNSTVVNSGFISGLSADDAKVKISKWLEDKNLGKITVRYHLHDWSFSRKHYWGEPIPIVYCDKCGMVPVDEKDLPIELPYVDHYEPTETGESPLAAIEDWVNTTCPKCGGPAKRETDTMPNWAGSNWYFLRYIDPHNDKTFADRSKVDYWMPVDIYDGGSEHITLHLLYSRFVYKVLSDVGVVPGVEPYAKRRIHGMILGEGGVKMSKSLGNVINPDDMVNKYGADVTRAYMLFMGPYDKTSEWSDEAVQGVNRFVDRLNRMLGQKVDVPASDAEKSQDVEKALHRLAKKVHDDILNLKFNTSVAAVMEFVNDFKDKAFTKDQINMFLRILAPIVPHLAEEMWEKTGFEFSVHQQSWPVINTEYLKDDEITIPVQINGKVRDSIVVTSDDNEDSVRNKALAKDKVLQSIAGKEIKRFVYVPNKIVSIVT